MNDPITEVSDFLKRYTVQDSTRMLVGISGGVDSVVLAYCLWQLGFKVGLAHVNYELRGPDAEKDELLVRDYGKSWGVPVYCLKAGDRIKSKANLQKQAREIRYAYFEQICSEKQYEFVALGHHLDDQVETTLINLFSGSAHRFAIGISDLRGRYIRPLLNLSKERLYAFAKEHSLIFREDSSNAEPIYLRNRIRLELLPLLREIFPDPNGVLIRKLNAYRELVEVNQLRWQEALQHLVYTVGGGEELDLQGAIDSLSKAELHLLLGFWLDQWSIHGSIRESMLNLVHAEVGAHVSHDGKLMRRTRRGLLLIAEHRNQIPKELNISWQQGQVEFTWFNRLIRIEPDSKHKLDFGAPNVLWLDRDKLVGPITVRSWQQGDKMRPLGMKGHKLISDIYIDEKYSFIQKEETPIFLNQGKVIALGGFRPADFVKISPTTKHVMRIELLMKE